MTLSDFVLISFLIVSAISIWLMNNKKQESIIIYKNNVQIGIYDLTKNQEINIGNNIIEINAHKYRMKYSDCHNQICVKQKWTDVLPIICVPYKISVQPYNKPLLITY